MTTIDGNISGTSGGLKGYLDAEASWASVKYYPETDTKETFMKRCIKGETGKRKAQSYDKSKILCSTLWDNFQRDEKVFESVIDDSLDYLLDMDFIHLSLDQAKTLETIFSDLETIGSELNSSHFFQGQASGSRKQAMRAYYRKHKNAILMRRKQLSNHISAVSKAKKKEIMAKSDRTPNGKKKKKNWKNTIRNSMQIRLHLLTRGDRPILGCSGHI